MMLAGKKSIVLKTDKLKLNCPNCNHTASISLKIMGDYSHLLHIPFISKGKRGEAHCSNCSHILTHQQMKTDLKLAYFELKENIKTPIWFFSGLIVVKLLIIYKIIFINQ